VPYNPIRIQGILYAGGVWTRGLKRRFYGRGVVASLGKALYAYDDYLCLEASNKQQIN